MVDLVSMQVVQGQQDVTHYEVNVLDCDRLVALNQVVK